MTDNPSAPYNYDSFIPENFHPWSRFHLGPPIGDPAPDFPVWNLDGSETSLAELWSAQAWLIVEFGSFT